jgi:hypothetical protein
MVERVVPNALERLEDKPLHLEVTAIRIRHYSICAKICVSLQPGFGAVPTG